MRLSKFFVISYVVLGLVTVTALWLICRPLYILYVTDIDTQKDVMVTRVTPGDNMWIVFINSVEKLPVADHFVVNQEHELIFTETVYMAPYAGYTREKKVQNVGPGTSRIHGYDRKMDKVTFFAGDISRHMLLWNGHWVSLYEVADGGDIIEINIEAENLAQKWMEWVERSMFND